VIPPNDWEIKKCLALCLGLLLAILGLIGLAVIGLDLPGLRQIAGFLFLTFVPGILILRILKIHNVGTIESLLYSVGLSLAFLMFTGVFANFILPFLGVSKPISIFPIVAILAIFTAILMVVAYKRDKGFLASGESKLRGMLSPSVLFLILLLLITVLGALVVNSYQNNMLLLIFILAVAGVVGLAAFGKFIQPRIYPMAIVIVALCLLYQTTLISPYLVGSDIQTEHYFYQLVAESGYWEAAIPSSVNSTLSIVMLAPIYSLILNTSAVWLFKVVYPFVFSLVPLALFHTYSQQMSSKKAFLAAFFFVAVPTFSLEMISLARQQIAELFFVLFILLMVDRKLGLSQRLALAIIFTISMAVSHYALGFIGFIYLGLFLPLVFIIRSRVFKKAWGRLTEKFGGLPRSLTAPGALPVKVLVIVAVVYLISSFAWYGITASGVNLDLLGRVWTLPTTAITTQPTGLVEFGQREGLIRTALGLDFLQASLQGKGFRILQYITQLFLIAGCLRLIFRPKHLRFTAEYVALSVTSALLVLACIVLPVFASMLNTSRMYHIILITLAPFCILGGEAIWQGVSSLWRKIRQVGQGFSPAKAADNQAFLGFITIAVLIPYFLFTSGFVFEVTKDKTHDVINEPYSIALSSYRLDLAAVFNRQDVAGADWLAQKYAEGYTARADIHGWLLLCGWPQLSEHRGGLAEEEVPPNSYIFFRSWNIKEQAITTGSYPPGAGLRRSVSFDDLPWLVSRIDKSSKIYDNGGAQVLLEESN